MCWFRRCLRNSHCEFLPRLFLFSVTPETDRFRLFFNILHPPLNVPALAVSLDDDVDTNKELVAHGYSNFLSGIVGSVYVNLFLSLYIT